MPLTLDLAIAKVKESLTCLKKYLDMKDEKPDLEKEIQRRFLVRELARLGERLLPFKGDPENKLPEGKRKKFQQQLEVTASLNDAKEGEEKYLIGGFISLRNKLLHKYPFQYWFGNDTIYTNFLEFFSANFNTLEKRLELFEQEIKKNPALEKMEVEKLNFDMPKNFSENEAIDFSKDYLLALEVAVKEVDSLFQILKYFGIDADNVVKQIVDLKKALGEHPLFENTLSNCLENISVALTKSNEAYDILRDTEYSQDSENSEGGEEGKEEKSEPKNIQKVFDELDELYNVVCKKAPKAILYLNQAKSKRINTAHEKEDCLDLNQIALDISYINLLYKELLKPSLQIAMVSGYLTHPSSLFFKDSSLKQETTDPSINVNIYDSTKNEEKNPKKIKTSSEKSSLPVNKSCDDENQIVPLVQTKDSSLEGEETTKSFRK